MPCPSAAQPLPPRNRHWRPGALAGEGAPCRHAEVLSPPDEASGAALALALALDTLACAADATADTPDERPWLWVQDKAARRLTGRPYRPGLPAPLRHRLIHVAADSVEDALFALEEGLRCRDLAFVLGEIAGNPRALTFTATRRLSLAAERHGVPLWLVRPGAARDLSSARMRWEARAAPGPPPRWNPQAPGAPAWHADLFRSHTFQPGTWILRDEHGTLRASSPHPPDHGHLVPHAGDGPLAVAGGNG